MVNRIVLAVAAMLIAQTGVAQVGAAVKEGSKATAEKAQQLGDEAKAALSSEPNKSLDETKAKEHKAKAHYHAHKAKSATKDIGK
jgi:hypothetical protein